jgi:hypothetical protein
MAFDSEGNIWLAVWDPLVTGIEYGYGLTKFDGTNWTTYNIYNSPLTSNTIFNIAVDKEDNLWLSTCAGGLVKFDRKETWTVYNIRNSGIAFDSQNLVAIDSFGNKWIGHNESGLSIFREGGVLLTGVNDAPPSPLPSSFAFKQNYPNPFNPSTTITFNLPKRSDVTLTLYSILAEKLKTITSGTYDAGEHKIIFNAAGLASGVYFYTLNAGNFSTTKKLVVIR